MAKEIKGRMFARTFQKKDGSGDVTFYNLKSINGYSQLVLNEKINTKEFLKKLDLPALVKVNVTGAKMRISSGEDGIEYRNRILYVDNIEMIDEYPELENLENEQLEMNLNEII